MGYQAAEDIIGASAGGKHERLGTSSTQWIKQPQDGDMLVLLADDGFQYLAYRRSLHYPAMLAVGSYSVFTDDGQGGSSRGYGFFHSDTIAPQTVPVK